MSENKIANNPDFTDDESPVEGDKEVNEESTDEVEEEDTQSDPSTDEESVDEPDNEDVDDEVLREQQGLSNEFENLKKQNELMRQQIVEQRKMRRANRDTMKQIEAQSQENEIDLSDIDQEDIERMEKVLRAKGYAPKDELIQENFKMSQQQIETEFFEHHPEYKPENDANDVLYNALREEFGMFAQPKTPQQVKTILERAHREVSRRYPGQFPSTGPSKKETARAARRSVATAGAGRSGSSRSSGAESTLTREQIQQLKDGGFTDEEIAEM